MPGPPVNAAAPGFFGKVTTHGDFVTRALPPELVQAWDEWMQHALQASRQQLGADWLTLYLTSPIWRFAIGEGVLTAQAWAGVMMPSVDWVGRHFPLMIAAPVVKGTAFTALVTRAVDWYDALEEQARDTLVPEFVLEQLASTLAGLASMPATPGVHCTPGQAGWRLACGARDALPPALADVLLQGHSLWWSDAAPGVQNSMLACAGMPGAPAFAAMLDGRWQDHGWGVARPA